MTDDDAYIAIVAVGHKLGLDSGDLVYCLLDSAARTALANKKPDRADDDLAEALADAVNRLVRGHAKALRDGEATKVASQHFSRDVGHG